jgi:hypothetical protein
MPHDMIDEYFKIYNESIQEYGENICVFSPIKCLHKNPAYCKECKGSQICDHNNIKYYCKECGGKGICTHNRRKQQCKDCKGSQICAHNNRKAECKECNGSQICKHKKQKNSCKECQSYSICKHNIIKSICEDCKCKNTCEHNKIKSVCKLCKGGSICHHNKVRSKCKDCEGSAYCKHKRIKIRCKECNGSQICKHNKRKDICIECNGNSICKHKKRKYYCIDCRGSQICNHNKNKFECKECNEKFFCRHNIKKKVCIICSPNSNQFCKECKLLQVNKKTNYLCSYCNPHKPTRQKTKELKLKNFLKENNYNFDYNKCCTYNEKKYYPDFIIKCNSFILIIECDEYAHTNYNKESELIRENNIRLALNETCVFIRYNPDNRKYKTKNNIKTKEILLKSYIEYYINKTYCDNEKCYLFY